MESFLFIKLAGEGDSGKQNITKMVIFNKKLSFSRAEGDGMSRFKNAHLRKGRNECREKNIQLHPARMPEGLASFFIQFLTDPGDIVLDPFAGSNTTGFVAECLGRKWVSIEAKEEYVEQVKIRFEDPLIDELTKRRKNGSN